MIEVQVPALRARIDQCAADFAALRDWRKAHAHGREGETASDEDGP